MIPAAACLAAALAAACSLIVTAGPEGDAASDTVEEDGIDGLDPAGEDPAGEPEADTGGETGTDTPEALCGNGVREPPEECDAPSALCVECRLVPPAGWHRCLDPGGDPRFFKLADFGNGVTWVGCEAQCRALVEDELSPVLEADPAPYVYGYAVLDDAAVWGCVGPVADEDPGEFFWIGLRQDDAAAEPDGGWAWTGMDRSGGEWREDYVEGRVPQIAGDFDDSSGTNTNVDCGLLKTQGGAFFIDYACNDYNDFKALCMIRFFTTD